jgi:hypothetical protein
MTVTEVILVKLVLVRHLFNNNSLTKFHENLTHGLVADNGLESHKRLGWCHLCIRLRLHWPRSLTAFHSDDVAGKRTSHNIHVNKQFETCLSGYSSYDLLVRRLTTLQTYSDEIKSSFKRTVVCSCTPTFSRVQRS